MNVSLLAGENSVFKEAYAYLLEVIRDMESRYDEKIYVDTMTGMAKNWLNTNVYIHGDRNIVNLITIRMVNWQLKNTKAWDCKLFVYPAEDRNGFN